MTFNKLIRRFVGLSALLFGLLLVAACDDDEALLVDTLQHISITEGMDFYYYCNVDIDQAVEVDRYENLLIYVHGAGLDADFHYISAVKAADYAGVGDNTIVLAPQYDVSNYRNNYYWTQFSWKDGRKSINAVPKISSYALLDSLIIDNVLKSYPKIKTIVLSGHSAGAQFVYRYSTLSQLPDLISQELIYLPLNPSSVTYMGPERWNASKDRFEIPLNAPSCPAYNEWNYGIDNLSKNEYNRDMTAEEVRAFYPWRKVTIGIGTEDLNVSDKTCEDLYQGNNRFERAHYVYHYMKNYFPGTLHELIEVEGVGHNSDEMMESDEIVSYLSEVFN